MLKAGVPVAGETESPCDPGLLETHISHALQLEAGWHSPINWHQELVLIMFLACLEAFFLSASF